MSNNAGKDVIYVDVDDEITAIIDKVRSSHERIVALVLPKRATVFQSIVNMKLLKRSADEAKKHMVLITNEASLLPLAGTVGLYVAKSLQSKPEVPAVPGAMRAFDDEEAIDEAAAAAAAVSGAAAVAAKEDQLDKGRTVGDYARSAATGPLTPNLYDEETIELDNSAENEMLTPAEAAKKSKDKKSGKKFSIPNFDKFRIWLILGGAALVVLIVGWYMAAVTLPKAAVTIKTDSIAVSSSLSATLLADANAKTDIDKGQIPAFEQKTQKTQSQQVEATGQKDKGTKASGKVTISLKDCTTDTITIPAGTGVAANGLTFIMQSKVTLTSVKLGNQCKNGDFPQYSSGTVNVISQTAGDKYNLPPTSYTVAGYSNVNASGSAMAGGTSNIVKIVSQADVDKAKQQIAAQDTSVIKQELMKGLTAKDYYALDSTFSPSEPQVTMSAQVGDEAESITVTQNTDYVMLGAKKDDLEKLVANNVADKVDPKKQRILDYGLDDAVFNIEKQEAKRATVSMQSTVVAGSQLDLNAIKKQIAGKKTNQVKEIIQGNPGVKEVTVEYSPFWVSSIPKNTGKITLDVEKPQTTKNESKDE